MSFNICSDLLINVVSDLLLASTAIYGILLRSMPSSPMPLSVPLLSTRSSWPIRTTSDVPL